MSQNFLKYKNLEFILQKFINLFIECSKEYYVLKQKLIEIEILDITDEKIFSFIEKMNSIPSIFSDLSLFFDHQKLFLKIRDLNNVFDISKLYNSKTNSKIINKFNSILTNIASNHIFFIQYDKNNIIKIFEIKKTFKNKFNIKILKEYKYYSTFPIFSTFFFPFCNEKDYDFQKTKDFLKINGLFNSHINLIVKFLDKKILKNLLELDIPTLIEEIAKIYSIDYIFSIHSDHDSLLVNILEENKYDFILNIYINTVQFFNILNINEILDVFNSEFELDQKPESINQKFIYENQEIMKINLLTGITQKIKGNLFFFKFKNKKILFNSSENKNNIFLNTLLAKVVNSLQSINYGFAITNTNCDLDLDYLISRKINTLKQKKLTTSNFSIIFIINFENFSLNKIEPDLISNLFNGLINFILNLCYESLNKFKKNNEYKYLYTVNENKLTNLVQNDIPKICLNINNVLKSLNKEEIDPLILKKKLLKRILFENI